MKDTMIVSPDLATHVCEFDERMFADNRAGIWLSIVTEDQSVTVVN